MMTHEYQAWIAQLRVKAIEKTLTADDMREYIKYLRQDRQAAGQEARTTAAKRKKAFATIPTADTMLGELEGL